ncbi:hypothetical protein BJ741DRAFT_607916 [Chytriomyces cf. hyalinus JEL632]|nr:hypothetical protein BJ741DRAFT_607916 [Chytriomyces cf. hyalinus JEL632]
MAENLPTPAHKHHHQLYPASNCTDYGSFTHYAPPDSMYRTNPWNCPQECRPVPYLHQWHHTHPSPQQQFVYYDPASQVHSSFSRPYTPVHCGCGHVGPRSEERVAHPSMPVSSSSLSNDPSPPLYSHSVDYHVDQRSMTVHANQSNPIQKWHNYQPTKKSSLAPLLNYPLEYPEYESRSEGESLQSPRNDFDGHHPKPFENSSPQDTRVSIANLLFPIEHDRTVDDGDNSSGGESVEQQQVTFAVVVNAPRNEQKPRARKNICTYPGCEKGFTSNAGLRIHEAIHTGIRSHLCVVCGRSYTTANRERKKLSPPQCTKFSSNFFGKQGLKVHSRSHSGDFPYSCTFPNCDYRAPQKCSLSSHMLKHLPAHQKKEIQSASARTIPCRFCGKMFKSEKSLDQHSWQNHRVGIRHDGPLPSFQER